MQFFWLNKQNNKNLIVFFNGWGMNQKIVSHLNCSRFDILVFFDYQNFEIQNFDFSSYEKKYLIGWSMGVYVCNYFYEKFKEFNRFIALNGTLKPIDDNFGIPEMVYNLTVENFNELSCSKFMRKISSAVDLKEYCTRDMAELKNELIKIKELQVKNYFKFDKAVISKKDRIFPLKNLINFWKEQSAQIIEINSSHYIFDLYKSWDELL